MIYVYHVKLAVRQISHNYETHDQMPQERNITSALNVR